MLEQELREMLTREMAALIEDIKKQSRAAGQVVTGRTLASLRANVSQDGRRAQLLGNIAAVTLETGRRGGGVPKNFHLILEEWSRRKGLQFATDTDRKRFAWLLARKIAREGTALFRAGGRRDIITRPSEFALERINRALLGVGRAAIQRAIWQQ